MPFTTGKDIDNRFDYHRPDANKVIAHEAIREITKDTARTYNELIPESREKSLAITKLEEAMFWANAALARHQTPGLPEVKG